MKIYCNTQEDQDLDFFKSIAGTDIWVAVIDTFGWNTEWYINILYIDYDTGVPCMHYNCFAEEDVDNWNNYSEQEVIEIMNDPIGTSCPVPHFTPIKPIMLLTRNDIFDMLVGTSE